MKVVRNLTGGILFFFPVHFEFSLLLLNLVRAALQSNGFR